MVKCFANEEEAYEQWCNDHKNGFIFNNAGGKTGNVLHIVGCSYLNIPRYKGTYTTRYKKICSENIDELINVANKEKYGWRRCKECF